MARRVRSLAATLTLAAALLVTALAPTATATPAPTTPAARVVVAAALTGNWRATTGSYTGYRVTTDIAFVGRETIAGRTTAVTGNAQVRLVNGRERLTAARFTADLRRATTGNAFYDRQAASLLETAKYPRGTFVLTSAVYLPSPAALKRGTTISLVGNLTLHGVTRRVTVPGRVIGASTRFTVTGAIAIRLSDYAIPLEAAGGLARTDDRATVNFKVVFVR